MRLLQRPSSGAVLGSLTLLSQTVLALSPRPMENLGRGVVAVRASEDEVLVTWRLLGLDPSDIGFNVYRSSDSSDAELLNDEPLTSTTGTNFLDTTADASAENTYWVRSVVDDEESDDSGSFTLAADNGVEPAIRIPIKDTGAIKFVWVGDLDGDGEYDFVLDRTNTQQSIEGYASNGTFLWEVQLGPNSENQNNIEPGSTAISVGNWDGVTVFDFDSDGYAEVAVRIANGVVFGDGEDFMQDIDNEQWIAILDGRTGALKGTSKIPTDYIEHGPLAARFGVGYLDGVTPHLVAFMKNRRDDKVFNRVMGAWTWDGETVTEKWITLGDDLVGADGHNTRIIDVNGDGKDDVVEIGFVLNGEDGSLLYTMPDPVVHGDRYYIAKMDPEREGLQGYGIQQDNEDLLKEYYYDAADGTFIWEHYGSEVGDVGRGLVGDIDPTYPGMEVWSFQGVFNAAFNETTTDDTSLAPWPQMGVWWDGDALMELYNDGKLEKWDWENPTTSGSLPRILTISKFGAQNPNNYNPGFLGDILGDWREEIVVVNEDYTELVIFTTNQPSDIRLYTLPHNPAYRNAMTLHGYMQSHEVDYFLGYDMDNPPQPKIRYVE
ncbi:FG-GAP repeat family protein [Penicillium brasilianum]|uniref:FG-GAP repeat family protein n=1 Tax=Penicillium brasilianum TaxID=104259 RepID=A0A1S9S2H9_PENBI|nr:FG-GAP repeat family protein [Penicillium brasilianum]